MSDTLRASLPFLCSAVDAHGRKLPGLVPDRQGRAAN